MVMPSASATPCAFPRVPAGTSPFMGTRSVLPVTRDRPGPPRGMYALCLPKGTTAGRSAGRVAWGRIAMGRRMAGKTRSGDAAAPPLAGTGAGVATRQDRALSTWHDDRVRGCCGRFMACRHCVTGAWLSASRRASRFSLNMCLRRAPSGVSRRFCALSFSSAGRGESVSGQIADTGHPVGVGVERRVCAGSRPGPSGCPGFV